jgi:hypothetical protein
MREIKEWLRDRELQLKKKKKTNTVPVFGDRPETVHSA